MKKYLLGLVIALACCLEGHAVLKEKDLEQTLSVLRTELIDRHNELTGQASERLKQNSSIMNELFDAVRRSNQNSLMLYSQKNDFIFDLTYACHEATEQYRQFQRQQVPFRTMLESNDVEIARYDSLILSLRQMPVRMLPQKARTDRNVCLTLATNIRNTLADNSSQTAEHMKLYEETEQRLSSLNDYAQMRYHEIQTGIFVNGGQNYFDVLRNLDTNLPATKKALINKYTSNNSNDSQWSLRWIFGLFGGIIIYGLFAILVNQIVFRFLLPKRLLTEEFMKKRRITMMATTTITFALLAGLLTRSGQNFFIMASNLLIEFAWLLAVILISLLLRVTGDQIRSAFRIYMPLVVVGFIIFSFRIVLIPNELVNLILPPIMLISTIWQWWAITRHNKNIPQQDMFYTYISLLVLICSLVCSWIGYSLLAVQVLIWWIMMLTCILTITCISRWLKIYGEKKGLIDDSKPITKTWFYLFIYKAVLPIIGVQSLMLSIYWAAGVFNLSDLCWQLFKQNFVEFENLHISIIKLTLVVNLWFLFAYASHTILEFMKYHFQMQDPSTAASRVVMGRNVIQVLVWGIWLLISLSILNISLAWLLAISGGLSTGIGFASKNIIENIFYGASLMAGRLKVGDRIEVDGTMGKVVSISYTSTIVESLAGEVITFQNSQLFDKNYKNLTKNYGYVMAQVPFGVAYGSNLSQVKRVVEEAVTNMHIPHADPSKPVKTIITAMNDSSIDFKLFIWVDVAQRAGVVSDVLQCIYETLGENNIEIPFPQQDIHIIDTPESRK